MYCTGRRSFFFVGHRTIEDVIIPPNTVHILRLTICGCVCVHIDRLSYPSINYITDAGLDVVFDLFPGKEYTIILCVCVCVPTPGVLRTRMNVQVEVTVNTRPVNKSKATSSPVSVL